MKVREYITKEGIGDPYERAIYEKVISLLSHCTSFDEIYTLANVDLADTQIDLLVFTPKGIIAVDFKNYKGEVYCDDNKWELKDDRGNRYEIEKNLYFQAKREGSTLRNDKRLKEILGIIDGKPVNLRVLLMFESGSTFHPSDIIRRQSKWFGCITPEDICNEVKNYESEQYTLDAVKIKRIIDRFGGKSLDYESIIDEIWDKLPNSPTVTEEERNSGIYENIYKKLSSIHDNITRKEILLRCEHAMALATRDAHDTLPRLLDINEYYPDYEGYKNRLLLEDIFTYYFEYWDIYENGKYGKDITIPQKMQSFINKAIRKYGADELLERVKKTSKSNWSVFGSSKINWELIRKFYNAFPDDPDVIEWIFFGHITEYPYFENEFPEIVEQFFKNKELTGRNGVHKFSDIFDEPLLLDGLFLLEENKFLKLLEKLREYYPELKSQELFVDIVSEYYLEKGDYEKAKAWLNRLELSKLKPDTRKSLLDKFQNINWRLGEYEQVYKITTKLITEFISDMSRGELSYNYQLKALSRYFMATETGAIIPFDDIISDIEKAIEVADSPYLHYLLGLIYNEKGDKNFACEELKKSFRVSVARKEHKESNFKSHNKFRKISFNEIELGHVRWPVKDKTQGSLSTVRKPHWDSLFQRIKLEEFQKSALRKLGEICKETNRLKELFFFIEDLKKQYDIPAEIYAEVYIKFADWLKSVYSTSLASADEVKMDIKVKLNEVVLSDDVKEKITKIVKFAKKREKPVSLLLHGPPGCGKTMLARAIANELNYKLIEVSPSDLLDPYVGNTEKKIRNLFEKAIEKGSIVLFFDELDAIGFSGLTAEKRWEVSPINEMKIWLSSFNKADTPALFIGATNHIDKIDDSLIRPERISEYIKIPLPGLRERAQIFKLEIGKLVTMENYETEFGEEDYEYFAEITEGFSGAHINNLIRKVQMDLIANDRTKITREDVIRAIKEMKFSLYAEEEKHIGYI